MVTLEVSKTKNFKLATEQKKQVNYETESFDKSPLKEKIKTPRRYDKNITQKSFTPFKYLFIINFELELLRQRRIQDVLKTLHL